MAAAPRRSTRKAIGHRRRVEDEGEDEGGPEAHELDDDSMTEGSVVSDDNDPGNDSDTSNVDEASPTSPNVRKTTVGDGALKPGEARQLAATSAATSTSEAPETAAVTNTEAMLNDLSITDETQPVQDIDLDEAVESSAKASAPIVVSSSSALQSQDPPLDRRRREHEEYRKKRDEDPAFVPNRGAFFMHDHRHAGPSANGFRPFNRGARGRGRGGFGGPFAPVSQFHAPADPTTSAPWAHDMHETVAHPQPFRHPRHAHHNEGFANGEGQIPTCPSSENPINRTLSTEKLLGNVQVRVFFTPLKEPKLFSGVAIKQYTKLPDHRPPLRRDKPVRISLPNNPPRYIFPAGDRSFIFIPRAMRPNQQRMRGKPRSGLGSIGGYSQRTSIFGGSYYGSVYSPSIALSRRSSIAPDLGHEFLISPAGSAISRPPLPVDNSRPIVRLPPLAQTEQSMQMPGAISVIEGTGLPPSEQPMGTGESINSLPPPQTHPLPQKPAFQENQPSTIPMHQPRPQKAVSLENIESPAMYINPPQQYQQAFHQQVPVQVSSGFSHDAHNRNPSYPSQHSTGTPLSQIPERAIHAAPFQPTPFSQQGFYGQQFQMMPPQPSYYYPPSYGGNMAPSATAPAFIPGAQQSQAINYGQSGQGEPAPAQGPASQNLVAQEVNGMVYYYDASQVVAPPAYPSPYSAPPNFVPGGVAPSPDGFYYPQPPGVMYYPQ